MDMEKKMQKQNVPRNSFFAMIFLALSAPTPRPRETKMGNGPISIQVMSITPFFQ